MVGGYGQTVQAVDIPSLACLPVPEGVACGSDALTLLENTETRSQFIDELMEVSMTWQPGPEPGKGQLRRHPTAGMAVPECPPVLSPQLELFLSQRLVEMEEEADVVAVSQFQLAPAVLQGQTSAHVGSLLATTRALLGQLCTRSMQHLFMILASPRSSLGGWRENRGSGLGGGHHGTLRGRSGAGDGGVLGWGWHLGGRWG